MKLQTLTIGMLVAAGALGSAPAAWAACARVADPNVSVRVVDAGPRVISTKSIKQINVMAGAHGLQRDGARVLGITGVKIDSNIKVNYQGKPTGNATCVHVTKVNVRFGIKDHIVHVPREYSRGSCQFRVVMRHEMAHVDVNRRTVRKYATILKNEVRSILRRNGAVRAKSMVAGQNALTAVVQKVLDDVAARMNEEQVTLHAAIDKPGGKYAAKGQCQGW